MTESKHDEHGGHGNLFRIYMIIAGILAVATASSFIFNSLERGHVIGVVVAFLLILTVAVIKATLVGMYFMHLKWDWKLLYFIISPIAILAAMMAMVFMPDGVLGPHADMTQGYDIRQAQDERLEKLDEQRKGQQP
jgi:cytochrome c oxidase subunit 4